MKRSVCSILVIAAVSTAVFAQVPQSAHVVMVVEENHSYSKIIGNMNMPYLNGLAQKYGLAVNYYANTHPSIGNYFMLTTGQTITDNDSYSGTVTANNFVRAALSSGTSWKSYAESLPYAGYLGGDKYPYSKHHNPFAYFQDVVNSSTEKLNIVPFTQFSQDLTNHTLPKFSFVIPNLHSDMHDCPTGMSTCTEAQKAAAADSWLKKNIAPLLSNADFQKDGLLIITWDEGSVGDNAYGGGHVATIVVGPKVRSAHRSSSFYQEQSLLRTILDATGVSAGGMGAAETASSMSDFFGASMCTLSTTSPSVTICSPIANTSVSSPINVVAGTTSSTTVNYMAVWLDGVKKYEVTASQLNCAVAAGSGTHRLTVQAKNTAGTLFAKTIYVTIP